MYSEMSLFLERAMLANQRVEFVLKNGEIFSAIPRSSHLVDCDDGEHYECFLNEPRGSEPYYNGEVGCVRYADIAAVRRLDQPDVVIYAPMAAA